MEGERYLDKDFGLASTAMVTVEGDMPTAELLKMKQDIEAVDGVTSCFWLSDVVDVTVPKEILPDDVTNMMYGKNRLDHDDGAVRGAQRIGQNHPVPLCKSKAS